MRTLRGNRLSQQDQAYVLSAYIYRNTIENKRANPTAVKRAGGTLPAIPDKLWLETTDFAVRNDGRLDMRNKACHHNSFEIPEHKTIIEAWQKTQAIARATGNH